MFESLLASLLANGLSRLGGTALRHGQHPTKPRDVATRFRKEPLLTEAISRVSGELVAASELLPGDRVNLMLATPELASIVSEIYSFRDDPAMLPNIRSDFDALVHLYAPASLPSGWVDQLFAGIIECCDHALRVAIERQLLPAHEAMSNRRQRQVLVELRGLRSAIAALAARGTDVVEIDEFATRYRHQVGVKHAHIVPPHFDGARKVPIDQLYVAPNLERIPRDPGQRPEVVDITTLLATISRTVVLGNPGAGKSTMARKLCHEIATRPDISRVGGREVTPSIVVLRDYAIARRDGGLSIVEFLERHSNTAMQTRPPSGAFEYLLSSGRLLVIFDGLDELLDTRYRQEVSEDIEAFGNLYPATPILVTSRLVGYEQAPLDPTVFHSLRLRDFDSKQVEDYVSRWFGADKTLSSAEASSRTEGFLRESEGAYDLRSNPLMLALMCDIYRGENYIPRNRGDVYEKCAVMLFERWDRGRGIHTTPPFEAHLRPTLQALALWMYSDDQLQAGVTEAVLIREASRYLAQHRFEDAGAATRAARRFVEHCRGRAWVFSDVGTTPSGDRLYHFTHRTFLEYFAAVHLVRTSKSPAQLMKTLLPKVKRAEWDVVAQLAVQLADRAIEGASDALLRGFLSTRNEEPTMGEATARYFALRCLSFLVPTPATTRMVVRCAIDELLTQAVKGEWSVTQRSGLAYRVLDALGEVSTENAPTVASEVLTQLGSRIRSNDAGDSVAAATVLALVASWSAVDGIPNDYLVAIRDHLREPFLALAASDTTIGTAAIVYGISSVSTFVETHGLAAAFAGNIDRFGSFSLAFALVAQCTPAIRQLHGPHREPYFRQQLSSLGQLLSRPGAIPVILPESKYLLYPTGEPDSELNGHGRFAWLVHWCIVYEAMSTRRRATMLKYLDVEVGGPMTDALRNLWMARRAQSPVPPEQLAPLATRAGARLLSDWSGGAPFVARDRH